MNPARQRLIEQLSHAVRAYQRSTDALDDAVATKLGVNRTDLRCLDLLHDGSRTAGELAIAAGIGAAATTTMLDRLEGKGLIRRMSDPNDRRRVIVEVTEELLRQVAPIYGPIAEEGMVPLNGYRTRDLRLLADHFHTITELSERHRQRIAATVGEDSDP